MVVSIGHTAATPEQVRDAVRAGARLSTHLGNGAHAVLPRHPNYIWEQLACDDLWASLICDGHHLPVSVMRCLLRVKTPARTVLTCDASSLAGLPPGRYAPLASAASLRTSSSRPPAVSTTLVTAAYCDVPRSSAIGEVRGLGPMLAIELAESLR